MSKIKAGLAFRKDIANENTNLALILKETAAIKDPASRNNENDPAQMEYSESVYEDPYPERRAETSRKIAEIMAEERKKKAEFKEFQKKVKETREALNAAKKGNAAEGDAKEGETPGEPEIAVADDDTKSVKNEYKSPTKGKKKK